MLCRRPRPRPIVSLTRSRMFRGQTSTATVNVTSLDSMIAPVAEDDAETTIEDVPITIDVLANDFDAEGDPLTVSIATPPTNGTVVVQPDGSIEYTPDPGFIGLRQLRLHNFRFQWRYLNGDREHHRGEWVYLLV